MLTFVIRCAITLLCVYVAVVGLAWMYQRKLLYFPDATRTQPAGAGLADVAERLLKTPDGQSIVTWVGQASRGFPTILYFHGNGGSLEDRAGRMVQFMSQGYGITMMSYRGFSGSTGSPSEVANIADALLAFDSLVASGTLARDVILYGESLGSGVAAQVAAARPVGGLILDAPYTSTADVGAEVYWFLPVRLLMSDTYETKRYIKALKAPLLVVHGEADDVIPVAMGRQVHALAPEPKQLAVIPRAGHENHWQFGSYDIIVAWLDAWRAKR
jgi:uncharacterized protein